MAQNTEQTTSARSLNDSTQSKIEQQLQRPFLFATGTVLNTTRGTYKILAPLGQGGFADVYHCLEEDLSREFAIKVLIKNEDGFSLKDEARIAARLNHPNIVQIHAFAELNTIDTQKRPIIIYNFIFGQTLHERMLQGILPLDNTFLKFIKEIGSALQFAHQNNIYHRDIKPSNIIIDTNNKAYLTDFGLASVKSAPEGESMFSDMMRARLGGTIPYMPPELLRNEALLANVQSDIYSLAIVVYEMLTGQLPYHGRDVQLITNIIDPKVIPIAPTARNPKLPPNLDLVMTKALAFDPNERYDSVEQFINELETVTEAYASRNTDYQLAIEYIGNQTWLEAKTILIKLPKDYEDVAVRLEQVEQKLRIQGLVDNIKAQIQESKFDKALSTLDTLRSIDPTYEGLNRLHEEAISGRAEQEERSLEDQYKHAVSQFNKGEFQAALDTITIIKQKRKDYQDPENIEQQALKIVSEQNELRALYNEGREHVRNEEWGKALELFTKLHAQKPNYEDVNNELSRAQHFHELVTLQQQARQKQKEAVFAEAIDLLDALKNKNARYKSDEIAAQRRQCVNALLTKCREDIDDERFSEALTAVSQLKSRQPDLPQLGELENTAQSGQLRQQVMMELTAAYKQVEQQINNQEFLQALETWQSLQKKGANHDISFADNRRVESRARDGLYTQALAAVSNNQPNKALDMLYALQKLYPDFMDHGNVERNAKAKINRQKQIYIGAVVGVLLIIIAIFIIRAAVINGNNDSDNATSVSLTATAVALAALPTNTQTPSPTSTTSPTFTPSPTNTATNTPTSTATMTQTPTLTPTNTPQPANIATARLSSSIFSQPDENSTELTFINPGESVTVLDVQGSWIFVVNNEGIEGWAAANRFEITIGNPTKTLTPSTTPSPSNTPGDQIATTTASASLFAGPGTSYNDQTFVNPGVTVTVLGRSANESWLFVRTPLNQEGWVAVSLLSYDGDITTLPIVQDIMTPVSDSGSGSSTSSSTTLSELTFDFWSLDGVCSGNGWTLNLFMEGHGGDGRYTYYINNIQVAGPRSGSYVHPYPGVGTANLRFTGRITSGDGQTTEKILFTEAPVCNN